MVVGGGANVCVVNPFANKISSIETQSSACDIVNDSNLSSHE